MPTFRGKHDWIKAQAFYGLYKAENQSVKTNFSIKEWCAISGVGYKYLNRRITQFFKWHLICRDSRVTNDGKRSCFGYCLSQKAKKWLADWVLCDPDKVEILESRLPKDDVKILFL